MEKEKKVDLDAEYGSNPWDMATIEAVHLESESENKVTQEEGQKK